MSELEKRNAKAMQVASEAREKRVADLERKVHSQATQIARLKADLTKLQQSITALFATGRGSGPTA